MRFFTAVDALPSLESMKFPVFSLLTGNFGLFRDEFAADSPLQRRVYKLSVPERRTNWPMPTCPCGLRSGDVAWQIPRADPSRLRPVVRFTRVQKQPPDVSIRLPRRRAPNSIGLPGSLTGSWRGMRVGRASSGIPRSES